MNILKGLETLLGIHQGNPQPAAGNIQGTENPGAIPLQNSGQARPGANGYATGLQPASGVAFHGGPNNANPQMAGNLSLPAPQVPQGMQLHPNMPGVPMRGPINIQNNNADPQLPGTPRMQGGPVNPGLIPLQNSGFGGPGYGANLQRNAANPQIRDAGPFFFE